MTSQTAVSVIADVLPGNEARVHDLLARAGLDAANNDLVPFARFDNVHFARFFVMDAAQDDVDGRRHPPRLVFLADVDGPADPFLVSLTSVASTGLSNLYSHCRGYTQAGNVLQFMRQHSVPVAAKYVNTIGRTVEQIRQEATLRNAIQDFVDRHQLEWRATSPRRVRAAIQEFVDTEPSLAFARRPVPPPEPTYILGERIHFLLVACAGIVLFPGILLGLPVYVYFLRKHEQADVARDVIPSDELIDALAAQEDHGVQNPFTSAGFLKPGPFRRFTATVVLWGANFLTRHIFNHANLIGVKTIHFARWVFLDRKRRVIFASNYDGSLENYMDDFIDKIAWALNISFSNGVDYPKTDWLVLGGADDELTFKRFNLNHQLATPFWYAGYQGMTALNIDKNADLRSGLYGAMDDRATRAWLRLI